MNRIITVLLLLGAVAAQAEELRIASVNAAPVMAGGNAVIFHDEFDAPPQQNRGYYERPADNQGSFVQTADGGLEGGGMRAQFEKGQVEAGALRVLFGRNPIRNRGLRPDETYREIYWRIYVKHEPGWQGNPAKLGRATCLAAENWRQGFIAHVWGGNGDMLCIDPATGIRENQMVTTKYNDFANLKWLGNRHGTTPIFSEAESGRWVCVESRVKLNTPERADGIFELWIDGKLELSRSDLDWHGSWQEYAINAVFLENYWNDGSVKRQARWFDNFVIGTQPIGPIAAARPVRLSRTKSGEAIPWEVEIAADPEGKEIVWRSGKIRAEASSVELDGQLKDGNTYWVRVREAGAPNWSAWHSPFR